MLYLENIAIPLPDFNVKVSDTLLINSSIPIFYKLYTTSYKTYQITTIMIKKPDNILKLWNLSR